MKLREEPLRKKQVQLQACAACSTGRLFLNFRLSSGVRLPLEVKVLRRLVSSVSLMEQSYLVPCKHGEARSPVDSDQCAFTNFALVTGEF